MNNYIDSLLAFMRFEKGARTQIRTRNTIERQFREVGRRTRPLGAFSDRTSIERILYAVLNYENRKQGTAPVLSLTQKN